MTWLYFFFSTLLNSVTARSWKRFNKLFLRFHVQFFFLLRLCEKKNQINFVVYCVAPPIAMKLYPESIKDNREWEEIFFRWKEKKSDKIEGEKNATIICIQIGLVTNKNRPSSRQSSNCISQSNALCRFELFSWKTCSCFLFHCEQINNANYWMHLFLSFHSFLFDFEL